MATSSAAPPRPPLRASTSNSFAATPLPPAMPSPTTARMDADSGDIIVKALKEFEASFSENMRTVRNRLQAIEDRLKALELSNLELRSVITKLAQDQFTVKGSSLEAPLRAQIGRLFCHSLRREASDEGIRRAVQKVLKNDAEDKHKFDEAVRFVKSKMAELRTEERRKCLGIQPYQKFCYMSTSDLALSVVKNTHGERDVDVALYTRHLALFRSFIRHCTTKKQANHAEYRKWLDLYYASIEEDEWIAIMAEDADFNYVQLAHGITLVNAEQQPVIPAVSPDPDGVENDHMEDSVASNTDL